MRQSLLLLVVIVAVNSWAADAGTAPTGTIDREAVMKVIIRNNNQARFCFELQNMKTPGLKGHVEVKFVIGTTGKVTRAEVVQSSLKNANVEACLMQRIQTWTFPSPTGGEAEFSYPFNFTQ